MIETAARVIATLTFAALALALVRGVYLMIKPPDQTDA